jgi:hypothetical protein
MVEDDRERSNSNNSNSEGGGTSAAGNALLHFGANIDDRDGNTYESSIQVEDMESDEITTLASNVSEMQLLREQHDGDDDASFDGCTTVISETSSSVHHEVQNILSGRGALIAGVLPRPATTKEQDDDDLSGTERSDEDDDLESGLHPPDSDYASYAPASIFGGSTGVGLLGGGGTVANRSTNRRAEGAAIPEQVNAGRGSGGMKFLQQPRKKLYALALVSVLLLGVVIAVSVIVAGSNSSRSSDQTGLTATQQYFDDVIKNVSDAAALANPDSPQSKARHWLLFEDTLWKGNSKEEEVEGAVVVRPQQERVVQRYVLAVQYYATNGPNSWKENNWLQGGDECANPVWTGLDCTDSNEVRTMVLGMYTRRIVVEEEEE